MVASQRVRIDVGYSRPHREAPVDNGQHARPASAPCPDRNRKYALKRWINKTTESQRGTLVEVDMYAQAETASVS